MTVTDELEEVSLTQRKVTMATDRHTYCRDFTQITICSNSQKAERKIFPSISTLNFHIFWKDILRMFNPREVTGGNFCLNLYYRLDLAYKIGISMLAAEVFSRAMTLWSPALLIPPPSPTDTPPGTAPPQTLTMYSAYLPDIKRHKVRMSIW